MSTWEIPAAATREGNYQGRRKTPSFSSSLLDAIYHSIDVSEGKEDERGGTENNGSAGLQHGRRNHALKVEEEIASLRRAIMVEKWMENYSSAPASRASSRRVNSDSSSSTDSSFFSSSETESASKSSSSSTAPNPNPKHEGRFIMRTKSRALKIYGDLKKVKQPISPGGKIANFLNSIFNSRNVKKHHHHHHQGVVVLEDWNSAVRKSRSVNYSTPNRQQQPPPPPPPPCWRTKSNKRSVRFCPVGVIVDEYSQPCGHMSIYNDNDPSITPIPSISSHYIKKNIDSFRNYEEKNPKKKHKYRGFYNDDDNDDSNDDDDDKSCTSSDLFELENIGFGGGNREELPVYGTTNLKMNQAIAKGLLFV